MKMILIDKRTALECWERGFARNAIPIDDVSRYEFCCDVWLRKDVSQTLPEISKPIEVLVTARERRRVPAGWHCSIWASGLPEKAVYIIPGTQIAISAPWFCFLRMASRLPFNHALQLGMELCGGYSTLPFTESAKTLYVPTEEEGRLGYVKRPPLVTPDSLIADLQGYLPDGSYAKALRVARLIVADSASPAETRFFLRLYLPVRSGGYGLDPPELNAEILLPRKLWSLAGSDRFICDFYHAGAKLAVEYDGGYHWNHGQRLDDNMRELILGELGIAVVRVDRHQLESSMAMDISANAIARGLGMSLRTPGKRSLHARRSLQAAMLDYGFDLYQ